MSVRFAEITRKMLKRLPYWMKMKKDPNSIGTQFLNVMGLELEDVEYLLDYATKQFYIGTVDLNQVDQVYKATIPEIPSGLTVQFFGDSFQLQKARNLTEFLTALETDTLHNPEVFYQNPYYLDLERRLVYVRRPYGEVDHPPFGFITMVVMDDSGQIILREELELTLHPVWNFLDEFGLLLNCPRLYGERNAEYKERILDVFRFPANSSRRGLLNGIARDLGMVEQVVWIDGAQDLPLRHANVNEDSILVDGSPWPAERRYTDSSGRVILLGSPEDAGKERVVRYTYGVLVHALNDRNSTDPRQLQFQRELWDIDGHATSMLKYYVALISDQVPVNWGQFIWDQGFWDVGQAEVTGSGLLPAFSDAQITGWRKYPGS